MGMPEGRRRVGRPNLRWMDAVKRDAGRLGIRTGGLRPWIEMDGGLWLSRSRPYMGCSTWDDDDDDDIQCYRIKEVCIKLITWNMSILWCTVRKTSSYEVGLFTWLYIFFVGPNTGCPRRKGPNFWRVFLRSNYTDITQNTYIRSSMVTEILNIEKWGLVWCLRTVLCPWRYTRRIRSCIPTLSLDAAHCDLGYGSDARSV